MPLLVLFLIYAFGAIAVFELLYIHWKRIRLIIKVKRACRKNGYRAKFKRYPFLSVLFLKGRLDFTVESEKRNFAVVIITTRFKTGRYVFLSDRIEIWKRKKIVMHRVAAGRQGFAVQGRSTEIYSETVYKGKIRIYTNKIVEKYPLHEGIFLINPAVNRVCISYGTTHTEIHDGDRVHSGFKVYGLSGFLRQLSLEDDWFGI